MTSEGSADLKSTRTNWGICNKFLAQMHLQNEEQQVAHQLELVKGS